MPPEGGWSGAAEYHHLDDTLLPTIDSDSGLDIVRNWLACGAPVVERTSFPPSGVTEVGDIVRQAQGRPPEPTFISIYERLLSPRCGVTCHGPNIPSQLALAGLDLSTPDIAFEQLMRSTGAEGQFCGGEGPLVVPGDPDASLLVTKLEHTHECGDPMPTGTRVPEATTNAVRAWIEHGANREE